MSVSASSSVIFGMASYMLLGSSLGPVLPFLGGSAFGFVGGLVHRYRTDLDEARLMLQRYPRVMEHHVAQTDPNALRGTSFDSWLEGLGRSLKKQGVLVSALYSASETIHKLQEEEEERIIDEHYRSGVAAE